MKKYHIQTLDNVKSLCNLLDKEQFTEKISILSNSSIGQHIRHIVEFYSCLIDGYAMGVVNYDQRQRNTLIETLPDYAYTVINGIQEQIESIDFNSNLDVIHTIGDCEHPIKTTFARELFYMAEHTLHHFALIKIGISTSFPEITLPQNFGIADSTVKHHQKTDSCAS